MAGTVNGFRVGEGLGVQPATIVDVLMMCGLLTRRERDVRLAPGGGGLASKYRAHRCGRCNGQFTQGGEVFAVRLERGHALVHAQCSSNSGERIHWREAQRTLGGYFAGANGSSDGGRRRLPGALIASVCRG
jgi:hypothetical protein